MKYRKQCEVMARNLCLVAASEDCTLFADFSRLLAEHHLREAVVAECVKHFVGNTSLETFDRFRYKKKDLREFGGDQ